MLTTSVSGLSVAARRTLVCKYVRRDMRKLRDADRERYFDAFKVMIETPSAAGQASFGDSHYRSLEYFVGVHMNLAADRTDDLADVRVHQVLGTGGGIEAALSQRRMSGSMATASPGACCERYRHLPGVLFMTPGMIRITLKSTTATYPIPTRIVVQTS